jgi:PAS domain S-box-containing protein
METLADLSQRETQLLLMAADGHTDYAISAKLGISVATVNSYWVRIRSKLGAQSRTEAVALALRTQSEASMRKLQAENERLADELANAHGISSDEGPNLATCHEMIQAAADGIMIVSPGGRILACNPALAEMFGYQNSEIAGMDIAQLVPDRYHEAHRTNVEIFFESPSRRRMGHGLFTPAIRKDGKEIAVSVTLGMGQDGTSDFTVCMVRDATLEQELIMKHAPDVLALRTG